MVDQSPEHTREIWQLIGVDSDGEVSYEPPPEPPVTLPKIWPASVLAGLIQDYTYWEGRGISEATVAPFGGGVATRFQMADRWVIPQYNEDGEIIGFSGRCLRKLSDADRKRMHRPKWKHLSPSSSFVWGGLDEVHETRRAILCESIGDVLALREHGVPEGLCLFGTNMSQALLGFLISANPEQIIVSTNLDQPKVRNGRTIWAGQESAARIQRTLLSFFDESKVSVVHPPVAEGVKDWGDCSAEQIGAAFLAQPETEPTVAAEDTPSAEPPEDLFAL